MLPGLAPALAGLLLAAPAVATQPPLAGEAVVYQELQARTGLDLGRPWADYAAERRDGEGFYEFTRARFRRRLGAGIGLSLAGLGLTAAGMALVLVSAGRDGDAAEIDVVGGALVMTAGFSLAVPGAILWPVHQVRLHKLKRAGPTAAGRVRLRAAAPVPLPRGLGLGFSLAF